MTPAAEAKQETPQPIEAQRKLRATDLLDKVAEESVRREIISAELAREAFDQDWRLARVFFLSGQFKDLKKATEEQGIATAMAKIRLGRGWGLNETEAMQFVVFINGVPTLQNEIIASRLMDAGYHWDVLWQEKTGKDGYTERIGCTLLPKQRVGKTDKYEPILDASGQRLKFQFGHAEASRITIYEDGKQIQLIDKWNYKSWGSDMFFWRCIARFKRQHATNILSGARMPFEAEEVGLDAVVDETARRNGENSRAEQERVAAERIADLRAKGIQVNEVPFQAPSESTRHHHADEATVNKGGPVTTATGEPSASAGQPATEATGKASTDPSPDPDATKMQQLRDLETYERRMSEIRKPALFRDIMMRHMGTVDVSSGPWPQEAFMAAVYDWEDAIKAAPKTAGQGKLKL